MIALVPPPLRRLGRKPARTAAQRAADLARSLASIDQRLADPLLLGEERKALLAARRSVLGQQQSAQ